MFEVKSSKDIGEYLRSRINEKYKSQTAFCKAILDMDGLDYENNNNLVNLRTKYSDIVNGNNNIKLDDLPIVTKLLDITCEELLSCGTFMVRKKVRETNYYIASSNYPEEWEMYMRRKDEPFFNSDEYGKTLIDYALEFKNYKFIKYLLDEGFISFSDEEDRLKCCSFNFGTKDLIRAHCISKSSLQNQFQEEDRVRTQIAVLAIENSDSEVIDLLHAREISILYQLNPFFFVLNDISDIKRYRNNDLIDSIVQANETMLDKFSTPFEIEGKTGQRYKFVYPFLNEVIERLIEKGENRKAELVLRRAISHNKNVLSKFSDLTKEAYDFYKEQNVNNINWDEIICKRIRDDIWITNNKGNELLGFVIRNKGKEYPGSVSNFFYVSVLPEDSPFLGELIKELNDLHDRIIMLKEGK